MSIRAAVVAGLVLMSAGCRAPAPASAPVPAVHAGPARYTLTGTVLRADTSASELTVGHDAIKDFMPAMAMAFRVPAGMPAAAQGDRVTATLVVTADASWLEDVRVSPGGSASSSASGGSSAAVVGALVPNFTLRNQDDAPLALQQFRGRVLLVSFIYTRCPLPDYCPRIMRQFVEVKRALEATPDTWARVHLLGVTFDPSYDTPAVLRAYGLTAIGGAAPFARWDLATGTTDEIRRMTTYFGVQARPEAGQISHSLVTAVIGADGRLRAEWPGTAWTPADVVSVIEKMKSGGEPTWTGIDARF